MKRESYYYYSATTTAQQYEYSLYFVQDSLFRFFVYTSWYNQEYYA